LKIDGNAIFNHQIINPSMVCVVFDRAVAALYAAYLSSNYDVISRALGSRQDYQAIRGDLFRQIDSAIFVVAVADGTVLYPEDPPHKVLFEKVTSETGGQLAVLQRNRDLGDSFVCAFEEFRTSYVVRYTFKGTSRPGWHEIRVQVNRPGRVEVRALRGYFATAVKGA
jgi:hypothetical protein